MFEMLLAIETEEERRTAEEIWARYQEHMFRIALSVLKNEADAEDAVMDTMRNIIQHISRFVSLSEADTLCLIMVYAKNASFKIYNKNKKALNCISDPAEDQEDSKISVQDFVILREDYEIAVQALREQSELSLHIFLLRHYYNWPIHKIAVFYDMSDIAVKKRLRRTKQKIKQQMEKQDESDS